MKKYIIIYVTLLFSISMQAQTEIEIQGWYYKGVNAVDNGNYEEAITWLEQCKEAYERQQKQDDDYYRRSLEYLGKSYHDFAMEYYRLGDYAKAVEVGSQAMEIRRSILGEQHPDYVTSLSNLAFYYSRLGNYAKAVELGTQAMEIYHSVLGVQHPDYATSLGNLANHYSHLGDYAKAVEVGTQAMEIRHSVLGERHPDYATSLNNLATYYSSLGDYAKAIEVGTQALEIRRSVLGERHPDYAMSLSNLASYYSDLGDYAKAVEYGTQALEIRRSILGERNPDYATSLANLALYYSHLGDYIKAVELGTQALEIRRSVLGERHPDFALSLGDLANYYSSLRDYAKAVEMGTQAMEIYRSILGEWHPDYATSLNNLAGYYAHIGDYAKAVELGTQAMEIYHSVLGVQHPDYATSLGNLASYYSHLGDHAMAVKYGTQAMEIRRSILGERHPDYATSLNNLANYYSRLGDYSKAVEYGTQALKIRRSILGERHPDCATSLNNLANHYSSLGDYAKAVELGTKAIEIQRSVLGERHPDYARSLNDLALLFSNLGGYVEAVELGTQAMEICRSVLGERHPDYARSLNNLALYYSYIGDYSKAVEYGTKAIKIQRSVLGEQHPDYATSQDNLALFYSSLGDYSKAVEYGTQAMKTLRSVLGEQHPDYAMSLNNLASYYSHLGDHAKTLDYFRKNISILQSNVFQQFAGLTAAQRTMYWSKDSYQFTDLYPNYSYQSHISTAPDLYNKSALFAKGLLLSTEIEMNRLIQESGDAEALRMFEELQTNRMQLQKLYETPIAERHINTDSLEQVVDRQEQALVKRSKVYGDFTRKLRTTWQDVQGALKDDEIAVEFLSFNVNGTDSTMVAALTLRKDDKEPKFIPLFEQRQLQDVSDPQFFHCPELTALVWQPLQQELQGIKRIYFSPAGVLHNIGIEYAPGMEGYEMYRLSTTREVIDSHNTHPGPPEGRESATTPDPSFPKEGKRVTSTATLFGGIDYDTLPVSNTPSLGGGQGEVLEQGEVSISLHRSLIDSLSVRGMTANYLKGTLEEVQAIKASFDTKRQPATLSTGKEATETAVKVLSAHSPRILHIATHGFYLTEDRANYARSRERLAFLGQDDRHGAAGAEDKALTRSGLLMAGANATLRGKDIPMDADDGVLTAQEISRLDLRGLDLVVLSACKTGNGDINQGEGVFGLQRGFKKAGAQTIVMSLWEVDDKATQILMTEFYDNLLQGQSKRDAFQNAQKHLRTVENGHYDEPQYWAAFILLD